MNDNSFVQAIMIIIKPFLSELDGIWRYLKGVCLGSLIIALSVWFFSFVASPVHFANAKRFLNITGWFMFIVFIFSYLALYVEIYFMEKDKMDDQDKNIRGFH